MFIDLNPFSMFSDNIFSNLSKDLPRLRFAHSRLTENSVFIHNFCFKSIFTLKTTKNFAETIGMRHEEVTGSMRFLRKLLIGPWDEEFIFLEPDQELTFDDMRSGDNTNIESKQVLFGFNSRELE